MIPTPLDIPPSVDCVALPPTAVEALLPSAGGHALLPSTGVDVLVLLLLGLAAVAVGVIIFSFARGRQRRGSAALTLVLLLAAGGTGLAVTAPASSASADNCTPLDYKIDAELVTPPSIGSGDTVEVDFAITNVVDRDGTPPVVVSIPKLVGTGAPIALKGDNWMLDSSSNPDYFLFTYSGPLPKGTPSSVATFSFALTTAAAEKEEFPFPVSIVTGSGGDSNTANNVAVITVQADGTIDYKLDAEIVSPASVNSGGFVTVEFSITNVAAGEGKPPIMVRAPKLPGIGGTSTGFSDPGPEGTGWDIVHSDPDFYYFEYSDALPVGATSTVATFYFDVKTASPGIETFSIPFSIVTGSGGDSNVTNNTVVLSVEATGTIDYKLDAELTSLSEIDSGDFVELNFGITNVTDVNGTEPVIVSIPRLDGVGGPITFADPGPDFTGWDWINQSDPDFFYFEYSNPLPAGALSTIASFSFSLTTADDDLEHFDFPVSILTGSGGDSNIANNTMVLSVDADGTLDYAISGTITPASGTPLSSGETVQINLRVANVLPRDGRGPLVVRIPNQAAFGAFTLGNFSPGWSLTYEAPYYVLTHAAALLEGEQTSTARLEFTVSNGNNSPVDLTIPATIETGSGGDSNDANNGIVFPLQVNGVVG